MVEVLRADLPPEAVLFEWSAEAEENPYLGACWAARMGFIVTADSVSMMVEVIYLRKPLAIFPLPGGWLGGIDQWRRSLAHWLFNPAPGIGLGQDPTQHRAGRVLHRLLQNSLRYP